MQYFVPLIPQMTSMGCWAASIAMVQSWAGQTSVDPGTIAARDGYQAKLATGLAPSDDKILRDWGFATEAPQSYTVAGFMQLLQQYGPLWVACLVGGGAHVRVVTGFDPDPDPSLATVYVNDPWQTGMTNFTLPNTGSKYTQTYLSFTNQQDALATSEMSVVGAVYVAHLMSSPFAADVQ
jgi:ABC-type bacteriocin/lantibiotic exporter with double-glycine peptidase domain